MGERVWQVQLDHVDSRERLVLREKQAWLAHPGHVVLKEKWVQVQRLLNKRIGSSALGKHLTEGILA